MVLQSRGREVVHLVVPRNSEGWRNHSAAESEESVKLEDGFLYLVLVVDVTTTELPYWSIIETEEVPLSSGMFRSSFV